MKTYKKPEVKIVEIENEAFLAGSFGPNDEVGNKSQGSKKRYYNAEEIEFEWEED